jgi:hypothetical protein
MQCYGYNRYPVLFMSYTICSVLVPDPLDQKLFGHKDPEPKLLIANPATTPNPSIFHTNHNMFLKCNKK